MLFKYLWQAWRALFISTGRSLEGWGVGVTQREAPGRGLGAREGWCPPPSLAQTLCLPSSPESSTANFPLYWPSASRTSPTTTNEGPVSFSTGSSLEPPCPVAILPISPSLPSQPLRKNTSPSLPPLFTFQSLRFKKHYKILKVYMETSRTASTERTFCNNGNVLCLHCPIQELLAKCGYWSFEVWPVWLRNQIF